MLHIVTLNVKISKNQLLLLAYFMGKILTTNEGGGGVSPILTLTNKGGEGSGEAKIMLMLLMDSPLCKNLVRYDKKLLSYLCLNYCDGTSG